MHKTIYGTYPIVRRKTKNNKGGVVGRIKRFLRNLGYLGGVLVFLSVIIVIVFLILVCLEDPRYAVKEVRIEGLKYFQETDLLHSINSIKEKNWLRLSSEEIRYEFMKNPFILDCVVEKTHPDTVVVHVQELSPYATLFLDDKLFLISHTGKILKQIHNIKESYGPLISGITEQNEIKPGGYLDDEGLWSALEFWYEYNQVPRERQITISEIVVEDGNNLKVFFNEVPCETRWKRENLKRQVQNFSIALNKVDLTRLSCSEYLDLRFNDDIIYK
ncbi:MAG TPA: FtsQ-type POTRA domain-containing protein [Candidatus Hydrogenedens sp.]|nr:FtsQ-type POTRA domain-containing protein [Candidatus Hydrogenedens sp.]HOK10148.1 FtsQ-type POTRA domain-containing protein [Candidatus Hydrogenedens sp.]HOL19425.1 FtsQ-type POTRA domain-containing protein [Candidatus Hydrogenedens sp.]HPP58254.1 FtsQ-type POTRA domain-containing protein [Candidatus Hydrogenedens sp.]